MKLLHGLTILNTRAIHQAPPLSKEIERLGGRVVEIPLISVQLPKDKTSINKALLQLAQYDWIVFTSVNSVRFFFQYLKEKSIQKSTLHNVKIAAVGEKTVGKIEQEGINVHTFPSVYDADHLADRLLQCVKRTERVLYPKSHLSRDVLTTVLSNGGIEIDDPILYETRYCYEGKEKLNHVLEEQEVDIITFTSPSTVHSFFQQVNHDLKDTIEEKMQFAVIGKITANALKQYGISHMIIPDVYTVESLVKKIVESR